MGRQIYSPTEQDMVIRVPFTEEEKEEFNAYVKQNILIKGRYVKSVILAAIREAKNDK